MTRPALSGMTGFGRTEGRVGDLAWVWEARSVNGRGLDVKFRSPPGFEGLEARVRDGAAARFRRGSVQVSLLLKRDAPQAPPLRVNETVVESLLGAGERWIHQGRARAPDWAAMLQVRGVVEQVETLDDEAARATRDAALAAGLDGAFDLLAAARAQEGAALDRILAGLVDEIEALCAAAAAAASEQAATLMARVQKRAVELLGEVPHDPQRLLQEVAALALKADVQEEIDRLSSHIADARALLAQGGDAGRRLDFLAQEFHREANTLTAKAATLALTRIGLDLKSRIDRLKEQAANVE